MNKKALLIILFFILFFYSHSAKADVYFSQPNSNGYTYPGLIPNVRAYPAFHGDDGSDKDEGGYYGYYDGPDSIANFASGLDYPIPTTSTTSYITDIILQIKDTNPNENTNYAIELWCSDGHSPIMTIDANNSMSESDYINSSTFSQDFVSVDFKFSTPNCDLSKRQIHQVYFNRSHLQAETATPIAVRALNANSIPGYGQSNAPGTIFEDVETQMTIKSAPYVPPQVSKTPVLIIPGTLGTEIWKNDESLWFNLSAMKNPLDSDAFMDPLAFKSNGTPLDMGLSLGSVLGQPNQYFDYSKALITDLQNQGYTLNKDLFLFPYDWRDEIAKNADTFLKQQIDNILASTTASSLNVIAHSQGGLLIKRLLYDNSNYYPKINKLIFVGTPNLGAASSAKILFYGDDLGVEKAGIALLNPIEVKKISQNMPAIYEMLPSSEYLNHSDGYLGQYIYNGDFSFGKLINNYTDSKNLLKFSSYGLNSNLIDAAENFHSSNFDNFDFTNSGIKVYSIMGCESPTIGRIFVNGTDNDNDLQYIPGDGTVPLISASNIGGATNYFILNPADIHSTLLTLNNSRQKIENILNGDNSSITGVTTNPALCIYKGYKVSVHSPANLEIYDENGNHVGPNSDGTFDYQIPEVKYDILDHSKYAFLPEGHKYIVKLVATGPGTFDFYSSIIDGNQTKSTAYYNAIPITASSTATVVLNAQNDQTIQLDLNGNGTNIQTIKPSSILDSSQSQDLTPPVSTSTITGTLGDGGLYVGEAIINLSAADPVIGERDSQTSGVLKIQYSLDKQDYQIYNTSTPITVSAEGGHNLNFFSTDKAGNNEQVQALSFGITPAVMATTPAPVTSGGGGYTYVVVQKAVLPVPAATSTADQTGQVLGVVTTLPTHSQGSLVVDSTGTVYLISSSVKHPFTSAKRFLQLGFKFKNVSPVLPGDSIFMLGMPM